jgi:hypothetical protein
MSEFGETFRVGAVQLSPVLLDRDATLQKVVEAIERCGLLARPLLVEFQHQLEIDLGCVLYLQTQALRSNDGSRTMRGPLANDLRHELERRL